MTSQNGNKCQTIVDVIAAVLLIVPNGLTHFWGNISVLTLSYLVVQIQSENGLEADAPWIMSLYIAFRALSLNLYHSGKRIFGRHCVILMGIVISDSALILSYFAVQHSLLLLNVALGVGLGLGSGLLYGDALHTVVQRAEGNLGLLTTLVQGSFAVGGVLINEFTTLYVNPDNLSPDYKLGINLYFTQKAILNLVPRLYLFISAFSIISHVIALVLLHQPCYTKDLHTVKDKEKKEGASSSDSSIVYGSTERHIAIECRDRNSNNESCLLVETLVEQTEYSPKEMLQTKVFYVVWFAYFVGDFPMVLISNYYKAFGQIWINDDHLLTNIFLVGMCLNTLLRCVWGHMLDKLKVKKTFIVILTPLVLVNIWLYFTPAINKYLYFVASVLFIYITGALYNVFPAVIAMFFGRTHFSSNYGVLTSGAILFNVVGPSAIAAILNNFGWFVTFATSSFLNAVGLFLLLLFTPYKNI